MGSIKKAKARQIVVVGKTRAPIADFKKWLRALRSGKYDQTTGQLQDEHGFCCLGVACKVLVPKNKLSFELSEDEYGNEIKLKEIHGDFPNCQPHAPKWLVDISDDFETKTGVSLADMNDNGTHFNQIAERLESVYLKKEDKFLMKDELEDSDE